jgi:hypothetical protein
LEERVILKDESNLPLLRRQVGDISIVEENAPLVNRDQPRDKAKDSRLPTPARAEKDEELSISHLQRHVIYDRMPIVTLRELLQVDRHENLQLISLTGEGDANDDEVVTKL